MTEFDVFLRALADARVEFLIVGDVAGRPRDFDAIAELEVLLEEQRRIESEISKS